MKKFQVLADGEAKECFVIAASKHDAWTIALRNFANKFKNSCIEVIEVTSLKLETYNNNAVKEIRV